MVAWNRAATVVLSDPATLPPGGRNLLRRMFTDPGWRDRLPDWEETARFVLGVFRIDVARTGGGPEAAALAAEDAGASVKPINVTVDFMRGGRERDTFAAATIGRLGSRIANVEAVAWQESRDKPIASARMNLMVRRTPVETA